MQVELSGTLLQRHGKVVFKGRWCFPGVGKGDLFQWHSTPTDDDDDDDDDEPIPTLLKCSGSFRACTSDIKETDITILVDQKKWCTCHEQDALKRRRRFKNCKRLKLNLDPADRHVTAPVLVGQPTECPGAPSTAATTGCSYDIKGFGHNGIGMFTLEGSIRECASNRYSFRATKTYIGHDYQLAVNSPTLNSDQIQLLDRIQHEFPLNDNDDDHHCSHVVPPQQDHTRNLGGLHVTGSDANPTSRFNLRPTRAANCPSGDGHGDPVVFGSEHNGHSHHENQHNTQHPHNQHNTQHPHNQHNTQHPHNQHIPHDPQHIPHDPSENRPTFDSPSPPPRTPSSSVHAQSPRSRKRQRLCSDEAAVRAEHARLRAMSWRHHHLRIAAASQGVCRIATDKTRLPVVKVNNVIVGVQPVNVTIDCSVSPVKAATHTGLSPHAAAEYTIKMAVRLAPRQDHTVAFHHVFDSSDEPPSTGSYEPSSSTPDIDNDDQHQQVFDQVVAPTAEHNFLVLTTFDTSLRELHVAREQQHVFTQEMMLLQPATYELIMVLHQKGNPGVVVGDRHVFTIPPKVETPENITALMWVDNPRPRRCGHQEQEDDPSLTSSPESDDPRNPACVNSTLESQALENPACAISTLESQAPENPACVTSTRPPQSQRFCVISWVHRGGPDTVYRIVGEYFQAGNWLAFRDEKCDASVFMETGAGTSHRHLIRGVPGAKLVRFGVFVQDPDSGVEAHAYSSELNAYESNSEPKCTICDERVDVDDKNAMANNMQPAGPISCSHLYHTDCLSKWCVMGKNSCPLCNQSFHHISQHFPPSSGGQTGDVHETQIINVPLTEESLNHQRYQRQFRYFFGDDLPDAEPGTQPAAQVALSRQHPDHDVLSILFDPFDLCM